MSNQASLLQRLRALIPELEDGRDTHVQWRDCHQRFRDANPSIGDKAFHAGMVNVYDERIACVRDAIAFIEAHP